VTWIVELLDDQVRKELDVLLVVDHVNKTPTEN
jgi:hypothetical protein